MRQGLIEILDYYFIATCSVCGDVGRPQEDSEQSRVDCREHGNDCEDGIVVVDYRAKVRD